MNSLVEKALLKRGYLGQTECTFSELIGAFVDAEGVDTPDDVDSIIYGFEIGTLEKMSIAEARKIARECDMSEAILFEYKGLAIVNNNL